MLESFLQFTFSGLTVGAVYALVALGFTIIYNASDVVNFAQGEFVMIGGMSTVFLRQDGLPLAAAAALAIVLTTVIGILLDKLAIARAKRASVLSLVIITIGASIFLRGAAQLVFDKQLHRLPAFAGEDPLTLMGATILPQSLLVLAGAAAIFVGLWLFFNRSRTGKAVLATANNRLAARLVGVDTAFIMALSFGLSAAIGATAGVLITPLTLTSYDVGLMLALKGFAAAMLGGLGNPFGALVGGLAIGLIEAFGAGYVSSEYKDASAFLVILLILFLMPRGLFGKKTVERV